MKNILNFVPGFRSKKKWKMIIASIYYFLSLIMLLDGVGTFLFFISIPIIIFNFIKFFTCFKFNNKKLDYKDNMATTAMISLVLLLVFTRLFIYGLQSFPAEDTNQNKIQSSSVLTPTHSSSNSSLAAVDKPNTVPNNSKNTENIKQNFTSDTNQEISSINKNTSNENEEPLAKLKIHFIDVGQADCILIQSETGKTMLIDAGNNNDADLIYSYLDSLNIKKIDFLIGTHPHEDHIGSLDMVINNFDIGTIYMPKVSTNTKTFEDVLLSIKKKNLSINTALAGININIDKNLNAEILAPNSTNYDDLNNYSVVMKLKHGNNSFLFAGDAEDISENEMLAKGYDLKSDLLKVGHHGSDSSSTEEFINSVSPKYAIISVGRDNNYGHPSDTVLHRLSAHNIDIYRTDEIGTIIATSDGKNITIDKNSTEIKINAPPVENTSSNNVKSTQQVDNTNTTTNQGITVYITKTGSKYHISSCSSLRKSKIPISLKDAKVRGYGACKKCHPPR